MGEEERKREDRQEGGFLEALLKIKGLLTRKQCNRTDLVTEEKEKGVQAKRD